MYETTNLNPPATSGIAGFYIDVNLFGMICFHSNDGVKKGYNGFREQKIDEAYRFLTSLPDMIERLLSTSAGGGGESVSDFLFSAALPPEAVDDALKSLTRGA